MWSLLAHAAEAVLVIDDAGQIRFANRACLRLFGWDPTLVGQPIEVLVPEPLRAAHVGHRQAFFSRPAARPMGQRMELQGARRDGSRVPVRIGLSYARSGEETLVMAVISDTSELVGARESLIQRTRELEHTNRELASSEERARQLASELRAVLDTIPDAILRLDEAGRILECDAGSGLGLAGLEPRLTRGRDLADLLPAALRPDLQRALAAAARGERSVLECTLEEGEPHLELRLGPLHGLAGASCLAMVQDVTERRRRDAMLLQASKLAAIGELAGNVAHEVNNPIGIVSAKARLLLTDPALQLPAKVAGELQKIVEQCDRISHLTRALLDFARPSPRRREPLDPLGPLRRALTLVAGRAQRGLIQVEERYAEGGPPVLGDPNELEQVFLNLLINAADAMPQGGTIVVSSRHAGVRLPGGQPGVALVIEDTGHGITPEVLPRIFEPFFTTKGAVSGTGLGLAICLGIVRGHGGTIHADSRPGRGATFTVTLPAVPPRR